MTTEKGLGGGLRPDSAAPDSREPSAVLLNPTYQGENGNGKDLANGLVSGGAAGEGPASASSPRRRRRQPPPIRRPAACLPNFSPSAAPLFLPTDHDDRPHGPHLRADAAARECHPCCGFAAGAGPARPTWEPAPLNSRLSADTPLPCPFHRPPATTSAPLCPWTLPTQASLRSAWVWLAADLPRCC